MNSALIVLIMVLVLGLLPNAFNTIAVSGIIILLLLKYVNLFKYPIIWYISFFVFGILTVIFYQSPYLKLFSGGMFGYGFFLVVMFAGVIPNKWYLTRRLKKNRGVLSVLGFISITPHAFLHVFGYFNSIDLFGIAAYVIMIPLTIVSFQVIKREIDPKDWLTIQKAAYGIYLLLFIHLLIVSSWENKIIYAVILTLYVNNKLIKGFKK